MTEMTSALTRLESLQESVGLSLALLSRLLDLLEDLAGGLFGGLELFRASLLGLVDHALKVGLVGDLANEHVDHVLLAGRELLLELLGERLPVDVLDLAVGLLELLLDLLGDSLDIVSSDLLDLVQDALEVLVLQVGKEAADSARVGSDGGEQGEGSRREEGFGELRSGVALGISVVSGKV